MISVFDLFKKVVLFSEELVFVGTNHGLEPAKLSLDSSSNSFKKIKSCSLPSLHVRNFGELFAHRWKVAFLKTKSISKQDKFYKKVDESYEIFEAMLAAQEIRDESRRFKISIAEEAVIKRLLSASEDLHHKFDSNQRSIGEVFKHALNSRFVWQGVIARRPRFDRI